MTELWVEFCDKQARIMANNFSRNVCRFIQDNPECERHNFCDQFHELFSRYYFASAPLLCNGNAFAHKASTLPKSLRNDQKNESSLPSSTNSTPSKQRNNKLTIAQTNLNNTSPKKSASKSKIPTVKPPNLHNKKDNKQLSKQQLQQKTSTTNSIFNKFSLKPFKAVSNRPLKHLFKHHSEDSSDISTTTSTTQLFNSAPTTTIQLFNQTPTTTNQLFNTKTQQFNPTPTTTIFNHNPIATTSFFNRGSFFKSSDHSNNNHTKNNKNSKTIKNNNFTTKNSIFIINNSKNSTSTNKNNFKTTTTATILSSSTTTTIHPTTTTTIQPTTITTIQPTTTKARSHHPPHATKYTKMLVECVKQGCLLRLVEDELTAKPRWKR